MKNRKVLFWSITVALGGFLFGFDTAVISGAEQSIQRLWALDDVSHGLAVAIALYGTVIGALFGGIPADRFGRKTTLFWIGILYLISALGSALAPEIYSFMFFRFLGGLGVGASSVAAPMYISEIAPKGQRGQLVALFQFNIVFGILIAYISNYLLADLLGLSWRWMLGIESLPALAFTLMVLSVPRSPRWLIVKRGEVEEARGVIDQIDPASTDAAIEAIQQSINHEQSGRRTPFFSKKYSFPIILAFLFAFFNQMSGINAIIYYAPRIFVTTGSGEGASLLAAAGIGLFNLIFTIIGMLLIDRFGRRTLMLIGSFGLILTLGLVANAFYSAPVDPSTIGGSLTEVKAYLSALSADQLAEVQQAFRLVPIFLFVYISFFAMSQGAVIWVFISEIFPNEVRGKGQSLGSFTHWIMAALVANAFPFFLGRFGGGPIFLFFTSMMVLQLLYVWFLMPETKGKSLEELGKTLTWRKRKSSGATSIEPDSIPKQ